MSTTITQQKKTSKQKCAMVASIILAAIIAMGSTFAWFTSKDKVSNQLSAESSYDVSIVETYNPPQNPTPGSSITKEVAAINTGNTAAYVQLGLENELDVTFKTKTDSSYEVSGSSKTVTVPSEAVEIDTTETVTISGGTGYTAVQALQAGGQLVYAAGELYKDGNLNGVDSADFKPNVAGLYVFYRNTDDTYAGYYYDGTGYYEVTDIEIKSGSSYTDAASWGFEFVTTDSASTASGAAMTYSSDIYSSVDTPDYGVGLSDSSYIQAVYDPDTFANSGDEIIVDIALAGEWAETSDGSNVWIQTTSSGASDWTAVYDETSGLWTFYYNHILSAGTTSEYLVTSMMIDEAVTSYAYTEFTYNLDVSLDSIQVVGLETTANDVYRVEIPSSSLESWNYIVDGADNKSTASGTGIYVNSDGQVCTKNGTLSDDNNKLTWTENS